MRGRPRSRLLDAGEWGVVRAEAGGGGRKQEAAEAVLRPR